MKLLLRFLCFILVLNINLKLNSQDLSVIQNITWHQPQFVSFGETKVRTLSFDNSIFKNPEAECPIFEGRIPLKEDIGNLESVTLGSSYFEALPQNQVGLLPRNQTIDDSISIRYSIVYEAHKPILVYQLLPLRKSKQTGQIERLIIFALNIKAAKKSYLKSSLGTTSRFVSQSVLNSGSWYKFYVAASGVYRITYDELKSMGITSPEKVRIFGNGGKPLGEIYTGLVPDDLNDVPIAFSLGSDNAFNSGDFIYFYAQGPITWEYNTQSKRYEHTKHPYASKITYFLTKYIPVNQSPHLRDTLFL